MTPLGRGPWRRAKRPGGWLWPDRNPLRRTCDRVEATVVAGLLVAFLVAAPLAALVARRWALGGAGGRASLRQVPAVLVTGVSRQPPAENEPPARSLARAVWTGPDGRARSGEIAAPAGAKAGDTVRVWVDSSGHVAARPRRPADGATVAEALAVAAVGVAVLAAGAATRRLGDWRRMAAWAEDWKAAGQGWAGRR